MPALVLNKKPEPKKRRRRRKKARGRGKGALWEREICRRLSLWLSEGKRDDLFWRSAMSGGRATAQLRKGVNNFAQVGDISAIDPEGARLLSHVVVECKFYRDLVILGSFLSGAGKLRTMWSKHWGEANRAGREPFMIAKQNLTPALLITTEEASKALNLPRREASVLLRGWNGGYSAWVYVLDDVIPTLKHWKREEE